MADAFSAPDSASGSISDPELTRDLDSARVQSAPRVPAAKCASIAANAAKVLDVTRHAWFADPATANATATASKQSSRVVEKAAESAVTRAARAAVRRVVPRRSQRANLLAALNYWSPRPL